MQLDLALGKPLEPEEPGSARRSSVSDLMSSKLVRTYLTCRVESEKNKTPKPREFFMGEGPIDDFEGGCLDHGLQLCMLAKLPFCVIS